MDILDTLLSVLFLIGAIQGVVYGGILWGSTKVNLVGNRLLAVLLFLLSYRLLVQTMRLFGLGYYDTWYYFMLDLSWVIGPLLYFYAKAQVIPKFKIKQADWVHFLPLLLQIGISIFVRLQNLYWEGTRESLTWAGYWGYVVWMNYSTIYVVASVSIIGYATLAERVLRSPMDSISIDPQRIAWIRRIVQAFRWYFTIVLAILLVDLVIYNVAVGSSYFYFTRFYYYPFFIGVSILTYWVGLEGFRRRDAEGITEKVVLPQDKKAQLENIARRFQEKMEKEKLYTQPDLSLQVVAQQLEVKPYLISQSLKEILETRFNEYINSLRVAEVQRLVADPKNQKYTLLSIAMEAGFNSKSSFNRAVKKHLGISPSELKETDR